MALRSRIAASCFFDTGAEKSTVSSSGKVHNAGVGNLEPVEAPQDRRLARTGRSDQGDDFAPADVHVDGFQHFVPAEGLAQSPDRSGAAAGVRDAWSQWAT